MREKSGLKPAKTMVLIAGLAALLVAGPLVSPLVSPLAGIAEAEAAEAAIGPAVGKPLKEAQELAGAGKYQTALAKVKEARAVPGKSAYESFVVADFLLFLNVKLKNYAAAAEAGEAALATGEVTARDRPRRLKTLVELHYTVKDYGKALAAAQRYRQEAGADPELDQLVVQARYLQGDYPGAQAEAKALAVAARAAGRKPGETVLQLWLSSAYKQKDRKGQREALSALAEAYPKPGYLGDLLNLAAADLGRSDRMSLEVYRLKLAAGMLKASDDYMEMAQLAIQLGLPGEALTVMEKGFAAGILGGRNKSRESRLLNMARSQSAEDEKTLAATAGSPRAKAALGEAYASYGKPDKAIALYRAALAAPFPEADLARLHLGQALLAEAKPADARKAFAAVKDPKLQQLAQIWTAVAK